MEQNIALTWQLSEVHGWGLVGVHTALYLVDQGRMPYLLEAPGMVTLRPDNRQKLEVLVDGYRQVSALWAKHGNRPLKLHDCNVLHALANNFVPGPPTERFRGDRNVGVIAFEDTSLDSETLAAARSYDKVVVHSSYNQTLLTDRGITNVGCAFQGVDPSEMMLMPPSGRFGDRFVIFSGGKMEFRKAQDIVVAAFRRFHQRHSDSLLITAWHNPWPETAMDIAESPLTPIAPTIDGGRVRITDWAVANGVPADGFLDLGFLGRQQIAGVLADCHAAIFPNRCEGATNLVAMEAMACGVPTILSANTGHLDLIRDGTCMALHDQRPLSNPAGNRNGWGDSSVEEVVEHLETLYTDTAAARTCADKGMAFIRGERTWRDFAKQFVEAVQ